MARRRQYLQHTYTYTKAVSKRGNFADKDRRSTPASSLLPVPAMKPETGCGISTPMRSQNSSHRERKNYITEGGADGRYGIIPGYMMWDARAEYHFGPQWSDPTLAAEGEKPV